MSEIISGGGRSIHCLRDRCAQLAIYIAALLVCAAFVWILGDILRGGIAHLSWDFIVDSPRNAGRAGGIGPILVSTVLVLLVALIVALPLGWTTAALLAEYVSADSRFGSGCAIACRCLPACPPSFLACSVMPFSAFIWVWDFPSCRAA